jgi:X-linked retinitis pigmentosa GTPase regulator
MGWRDALRALIESDEPDDTGEIEEIERGVEEAASGDEGSGDESEVEGDGDEGDGDEQGGEDESGDEGADEAEGTPGDEDEESAEDADLRAKIIEQAEEIETLRNRLAAVGLDDGIESEADAIEEDAIELSDEDVVEAFETDYADREARLAEIKEN